MIILLRVLWLLIGWVLCSLVPDCSVWERAIGYGGGILFGYVTLMVAAWRGWF